MNLINLNILGSAHSCLTTWIEVQMWGLVFAHVYVYWGAYACYLATN